MSVDFLVGDCAYSLQLLADESVHACVTSPPYWGGLRDYGVDGQLGLQRDPIVYVAQLIEVLQEVRRVLRPEGSLWLNIGDVYAASGKGGGGSQGDRPAWATVRERKGFRMPPAGYKMKDLTLVPFQVADALRRDGWYLRSTIIWRKPSAVEPMRIDRPAVSHEYIFLLTKSEQCAVRNPGEKWFGHSVWDILPERSAKHPAAFPCELARRCIVSSTREGDTVLDPFGGFGTTALVAQQNNRHAVVCELNPGYIALAKERLANAA